MRSIVRLMSPTHRRIVELNVMSGIDGRTDEQLRKAFNWCDYLGPGIADEAGWFIPESDPTVAVEPIRSRAIE